MTHAPGCRCPYCYEQTWTKPPKEAAKINGIEQLIAWLNSKCVDAAKAGDDNLMRTRADQSTLVEKLMEEMKTDRKAG